MHKMPRSPDDNTRLPAKYLGVTWPIDIGSLILSSSLCFVCSRPMTEEIAGE